MGSGRRVLRCVLNPGAEFFQISVQDQTSEYGEVALQTPQRTSELFSLLKFFLKTFPALPPLILPNSKKPSDACELS